MSEPVTTLALAARLRRQCSDESTVDPDDQALAAARLITAAHARTRAREQAQHAGGATETVGALSRYIQHQHRNEAP